MRILLKERVVYMSSTTKINVPDIFASMVFNDDVMRERLPKDVYKSLRKTIDNGKDLDITVANAVANAMKDWAIEKGATHYTHWFQPMTGITAEKHDSFISPTADGRIIMEFSGKELIKGEPDASSFPSGGLRATFEARGYTAWDPTSYAFIKDHSLYIPTAFCSYGGEVLDKKTPLLRSMEALSAQAVRILRLFGDSTTKRVITTVGPEQEYFLVDKKLYDERPDLIYTGRTLFGARAPKGQELEDHYFGAIKPRIAAFMQELDEELWKLGVLAKTKHNEVAPAQHELAPIFSTTNVATDHNQLTMETMKNVALRHGLVCLLHEKPFAGVNGSGKHNNWSISTDTGKNLLEPGKLPQENAQFLLFLAAVIKGVDEYQDLLRISVASAGNDHRLGANEAPPAIISIFLGDELEAIVDSIISQNSYAGAEHRALRIGVDVLPSIPQDTTDRNRTSPLAFTGNKFEFRMPGSSQSIASPTTTINAIMADELSRFYDELSQAEDFNEALHELVRRTFSEHRRIIFGGNGYENAWVEEAERRGLANLANTAQALPKYILPKNIELMTRQGVYSKEEILSRHEIHMEKYCKVIRIEARTLVDMVQHEILDAVSAYEDRLCGTVLRKRQAAPEITCHVEKSLASTLAIRNEELLEEVVALKTALETEPADAAMEERVTYYHEVVEAGMEKVCETVNQLEALTATRDWPYPTFYKLLFSV